MEKNRFGKIVEEYQEMYGVEKKAIYGGVCSGATFTRVQTQERVPDYFVLETLLARMGKRADGFESMLRWEDGELWEKRLEIRGAAAYHDYDTVGRLLAEYQKIMPKDSNLHKQFCLYYEMKLAGREENNADKAGRVCALAWQALRLTKQDGEVPHEKKSLYTPMEMELLLELIRHRQEDVCLPDPENPAEVIHLSGPWREDCRAESVLWDMEGYMEIYYKDNHQEEIEGDVWLELMRLLEQSGREDELRHCIEKALKSFTGTTGIRRLAELHFIKARLIGRLKKAWNGSDDWMELCKEECRMAYAICEMLEMKRELAEIEAYCREELQWHITL